METELKTGISGLLVGIILTLLVVVILFSTGPASSKSGAMKVLRESGYVQKDKLYNRSVLYYEPAQVALNKLQCEALVTLSDEYIIIINTCQDDSINE